MAKPKKFKLPYDIRSAEEIGLNIIFQEVKIQGQDKTTCQLVVSENSIDNTYEQKDIYDFKSWKAMKKEFPTVLSLLQEFSHNVFWESSSIDYNRILFIETSIGHEGLYEINETIWYDNLDAYPEKKAERLAYEQKWYPQNNQKNKP